MAESGPPTLEAIAARCCEPFTPADLVRLEKAGKLAVRGDSVFLSPSGNRRARALVRCHRLAEALLYTVFDLRFEERERIACEVEHTLIPEMADGICTLLGHPTECPDGKPIPPGACCVAHRQYVSCRVQPIASLEPGKSARVLLIRSKCPDRLSQLASCGLMPGAVVEVLQRSPCFRLRCSGSELAMERSVALDIFVSPVELSDEEQEEPPALRIKNEKRGLLPLRW